MAQKIKRNDMVKVIAGKDIDKEGKVLSVDAKNHKVVVDGINISKKDRIRCIMILAGVIFLFEGGFVVSNVMLLHNGQPTRVGFKFVDGKKVRFAKSTGEVID